MMAPFESSLFGQILDVLVAVGGLVAVLWSILYAIGVVGDE